MSRGGRSARRTRRAALCLVGLAAACAARGARAPEPSPEPSAVLAPLDPRHDPAFRSGTSSRGTFTVAWRVVGGRLPRNEYVELEVYLYEGGEPLSGADLGVSGFMPEHSHGLVVQPRAVETEPGRYLVSGLLLHMRGKWQLFFDVVRASYSERAAFELELR